MHISLNGFNKFQLVTFLILSADRGAFFLLTWLSIPHGPAFVSIIITTYWCLNTLFLPLSGIVIENLSKFKVSFFSGIIIFLGILNFYIFGNNINKYSIFFSTILLSFGALIFTASSISYSAYLVPQKKQLSQSFKIRGLTISLSTFIGPAFGGALLALTSYFSMILTLLIMVLVSQFFYFTLPVDTPPKKTSRKFFSNLILESKQGFIALKEIPTELYIALYIMTLNLFITPFLSIALPLLAVKEYHFGSEELGIVTAMFGVGLVVGSYIVSRFKNLMYPFNICLFSICLLGLSFLSCSFTSSLALIYLLMFLSGFGAALFNTIISSSRAIAIPDNYRSRIESFVLFIAQISIPIGSSLCGLMLYFFSLKLTIFLLGFFIVTTSILLFFVPKLKNLLNHKVIDNSTIPFYEKEFPNAFKKN